MEPEPFEYIAAHGILFAISCLLIGFAVIGIFTVGEEIRIRIKRHRYRKARDERGRSKWTKKSGISSGKTPYS